MREGQGWLFEPTFNRAIKLRQADPWITSDAGALLLREADLRLGLTADLATQLTDQRNPDRIRYLQVELLRQQLYALGYAHQDDQDALAHDVAMKLSVWDRPGRQGLAAWFGISPASSWRRDSMALRSVSTMCGGLAGLGGPRGRRLRRGRETTLTTWSDGHPLRQTAHVAVLERRVRPQGDPDGLLAVRGRRRTAAR